MKKISILVCLLIVQGCSYQKECLNSDPNLIKGRWKNISDSRYSIAIERIKNSGTFIGKIISEKNKKFKKNEEVWVFVEYYYGGYRGSFKSGMKRGEGVDWINNPMMEIYLTDKDTLEVLYDSANPHPLSVYKRMPESDSQSKE